MLDGGQIEPSERWINAVLRRLSWIERFDDSLCLLGNQQWFSTMDLASGYLQVAMSPEAKCKASFVTNEGLFQSRGLRRRSKD